VIQPDAPIPAIMGTSAVGISKATLVAQYQRWFSRAGASYQRSSSASLVSTCSLSPVLSGGSKQCLALAQVAGGTDLAVEGEGSAELCVGLGPTAGRDQALGRLQSGERPVGL
jgi:hypothetical protein